LRLKVSGLPAQDRTVVVIAVADVVAQEQAFLAVGLEDTILDQILPTTLVRSDSEDAALDSGKHGGVAGQDAKKSSATGDNDRFDVTGEDFPFRSQ
jgi:hypothetical protein